MMRSMYAGVSGLKNHQLRMDVIGNNIANVNTYGFKKSRVVFKDALYQNLRGGSAPGTDRGGTNPQAVGLGVTLSSIDVITGGGSTQSTGKNTDLAIDGNGYFILNAGSERYYTRAGNFDFDKLGNYLTPGNGLRVQGWMADRTKRNSDNQWPIDTTSAVGNIDLSAYKQLDPTQTKNIRFGGNFDSSYMPVKTLSAAAPPELTAGVLPSADSAETSQEIYDSLGNVHKLYIKFEKVFASDNVVTTATGLASADLAAAAGRAPGTVWRMRVDTSNSGTMYQTPTAVSATNTSSRTTDYYMLFDENGKLTDIAEWNPTVAGVADTALTYANIYTNAFNRPAVTAIAGTTVGTMAAHTTAAMTADFSMLLSATNSPYAGTDTPITMAMNFADSNGTSLVYQQQATQSAYSDYQDGFAKGELNTISVDTSGTILGAFSNGMTMNLGKVALATFQNPGGLTARGGNLYQLSNNSGDSKIGVPGEGDTGALIPSSLEMSNVDLSEEFTDMIVTQRGFQANSRVITTSDEMLQELVNLKR